MSLESVFKLSLVMNMIDNLTGPMAGVTSAASGSVSKLQSVNTALGSMAKMGAVMQEMGSQITGAVLAPVEATFETRRAIGELSSLGVKDLEAVEDAARAFSDQWAGTTKADFISAAYDIKSGIASLSDEGVADYTTLAGLTAKATKSTIGEMTSLFATGYGIYKDYYNDLSDMEFGEMFSAGIAQSVKQFKTTGSGMAQSIQALGGSATTANVPLEEQLSILGMLQATMGGSEAGTKYKAFLRSAAKGGEALGLSFMDANNQLLSMPDILDQLRGKFGDTMDAAEKMELQKAFGDTEAVALIDLMYNKVGDLQDNILGMYDALGSGTGVATEMANAMNETEPERFERLTQRIQNVKESIGNSLLPTINDLMGKGEQVLTKVGAWIEENQELVKVIMLIVLAIGGFLTVAGTVIAIVSGVGLVITKTVSAFKLLKTGFTIAKAALSPLISSVWSFTAALLANPITWVVIGIVALVAAFIWLWNNCEGFRNFWIGLWDKIKAIAKAVADWFSAAWDTVVSALRGAWEAFSGFFVGLWEGIRSAVGAVASWFSSAWSAVVSTFQSMWQAFSGFWSGLWDGIRAIPQAIADWFSTAWTAVVAAFTGAWEGVGAFFSGLWDGIINVFKGAINWIIDGINGIIGGINSVTNGGLAQTLGIAFEIPKIPRLAKGGIVQHQPGGILANIGEGRYDEAVIPLREGRMPWDEGIGREPVKKVSFGTTRSEEDAEGGSSGKGGDGKQVIIHKLLMPVDLKKIKDLQQLLAILKEVEDYAEANGTEVDQSDPDAEPSPT